MSRWFWRVGVMESPKKQRASPFPHPPKPPSQYQVARLGFRPCWVWQRPSVTGSPPEHRALSRSRDEKYWGLNFGSLHTPVWGRLSTKGNRPEEVITPVPWAHKITGTGGSLISSLNWKHRNKKEPTVLWFTNMKQMLDWMVLDGRTSNHWVVIGTTNRPFFDSDKCFFTIGNRWISDPDIWKKWGTDGSLILTFWCFFNTAVHYAQGTH
jgi:hypothetical protein